MERSNKKRQNKTKLICFQGLIWFCLLFNRFTQILNEVEDFISEYHIQLYLKSNLSEMFNVQVTTDIQAHLFSHNHDA